MKYKERGIINTNGNEVIDLEVWYNDDDIEEKLVRCDPYNLGPNEVFTQIKVEIIDLPIIYHYDEFLFDDLFIELSRTTMYKIFEKKSVQKLIQFNYPLVKRYCTKKLFLPFVLFQVTLFVYLNLVF